MKKAYISKKLDGFNILDKTTGELLDYRVVKKVNLEEFIMIFLSSIPEVVKLDGRLLKVLAISWMESGFGDAERGNIIHNNMSFKETVRKHIPELSDSSIDNAFTQLVKAGMMIRVCKGEYELNPDYFFKGKISDRTKLRFMIECEPEKAVKVKGRTGCCFFVKSIDLIRMPDSNDVEKNKLDK